MQSYAARPAYSAMPSVAPRASGSISHVNRLTPALDRGTYLLNYAVHLNDGRILYTEFLPSGYSIAGSEIGGAARKVSAAVGSPGLVNVADPVSGQMIATIPQ